MTTQILRTIDRWHFETPLALALGASAGFAAFTAPVRLMAQVPVAGDMGSAGRAIVAVLLAAVSGGVAYAAMRRPAKAAPVPAAAPIDEVVEEEDRPSGMPAERFARFRRADAHPDAPPREPIIASRDLGEPFMDVAPVAPPPPAPEADETWWPDDVIPDGDYVEVAEGAAPATFEEVPPPVAAEAEPAEIEPVAPVPAPFTPAAEPAPRPGKASIAAMMDRLTEGLERRASVGAPPPRDPSPALRDALAELNRLAERQHG